MSNEFSSHDEKTRWNLIFLIAALSFIISASVTASGLLKLFELKTYDLLTIYAAEEKNNKDIIIIEFDQKTVDALERNGLSFPWPRDIYEPVLNHLSEAKSVFIDVIFAESNRSGRNIDFIFRDAMSSAGNVFLAMPLEKRKKKLSESDLKFAEANSVDKTMPFKQVYSSAILPAEDLRAGTKGAGNVTLNPDMDGIYRRTPLFFGLNDLVIPQFVVAGLLKEGRMRGDNGKVLMDEKKIPLNDGELLLQYGKNQRPFEEISFSDVLDSAVGGQDGSAIKYPKDFFKNKYVLIGYTLKGLYDLRATPVSSVTPGVFIHATLIDNLITRSFIVSANPIVLYSMAALFALLAAFFVMTTKSMAKNLFFLIFSFLTILLVSSWLFRLKIYLDPLPAMLALFFSFISSAIFSYASEGRRRAFIRSTFSRYMDKRIVDHLLADPSLVAPGGTKCRCTVFFADIAGFTTISETISPEKTAQMLYKVLTTMTELIISHNGVIDKYIGDCIMAFWGAPVSGEHDEKNAVKAALACFSALKPINDELSSKGIPSISMRFGIHSGDVIVGNLGSERLFDYTVIGDSVNLASRLESVNKFFSTNIIISESTREPLAEDFTLRTLADIAVKGKSKPVRIYEVLGKASEINVSVSEKVREYEKGVAFFYLREFERAVEAFKAVLNKWPDDGPSKLFLQRCEKLMNASISEDGWEVLKMETK